MKKLIDKIVHLVDVDGKRFIRGGNINETFVKVADDVCITHLHPLLLNLIRNLSEAEFHYVIPRNEIIQIIIRES